MSIVQNLSKKIIKIIDKLAPWCSVSSFLIVLIQLSLKQEIRKFLFTDLFTVKIATPIFLVITILFGNYFLIKRILKNFFNKKYMKHETPRLISEKFPDSISAEPSSYLRTLKGGISVWLYIHRFNEGIRQLKSYRYIISHATNTVKPYKNVFSFSRGPKNLDNSKNDPYWRLWLVNDKGDGKPFLYPDTMDLKVGWHHFLIRWDHNVPVLELLIDGQVVIDRRDYLIYWPTNYDNSLIVGCWPIKHNFFYANTYFWRTQFLEFFPDKDWIEKELNYDKPKI